MNKDKFDINISLDKVFEIYNKQLNKVIEYNIKSQINDNSSGLIIKKGSKELLANNYSKKGNILKQKF